MKIVVSAARPDRFEGRSHLATAGHRSGRGLPQSGVHHAQGAGLDEVLTRRAGRRGSRPIALLKRKPWGILQDSRAPSRRRRRRASGIHALSIVGIETD